MLLGLLFVVALALAYANGANDNFKATATVYGAGVLSYEASRRLATIAQIAGSMASMVLAGALLEAFGGKGLVPGEVVAAPGFLVAVGGGAAGAVLLATRLGLPISTTHALVGGLAGAALGLAPGQLSWHALGATFFLPLATSPLLATTAAAALYPLARSSRKALGVGVDTCVCLGATPQPVTLRADGSLVMRHSGTLLSVAEREACQRLYSGRLVGISVQSVVDRLHALSAFSLGFARGLNDTPKVLALLVAAGIAGLDPRLALGVVALAMAAGGWLQARRVAETLSHRITSISHGQGLLANVVASFLVIGASWLGSPVSTTHVSTGALFGIGLWNERTDWRVVGGVLSAWFGTLPLAAALAASIAIALSNAQRF